MSPPVLMHSGLLCITFCLSVCRALEEGGSGIQDSKFADNRADAVDRLLICLSIVSDDRTTIVMPNLLKITKIYRGLQRIARIIAVLLK